MRSWRVVEKRPRPSVVSATVWPAGLGTVVLAVLATSVVVGPCQVHARPGPRSHGDHWRVRSIVKLEGACLARYRAGLSGYGWPERRLRSLDGKPGNLVSPPGRAGMRPVGRLDPDGPNSRRYLALLDKRRSAFVAELHRVLPGAKVVYEFRLLFNGVVVETEAHRHGVLRALPFVEWVSSTDRIQYRPTLDRSVPMIGAPDYWDATGGQAEAGVGIKVAVIDSGIDMNNPFFDPSEFYFPLGYPMGATTVTTEKVIASRVYLRPDDPVDTSKDEPIPIDHWGHGSHCAGIIGGVAGTVFDLGGTQSRVSGVAPGCWLMAYKVFYTSLSGQPGAASPELMAAFEDAVADGADVISNSWGGPDVFGSMDPSLDVYRAAVEAGCVVVFAAGNDGPGEGSTSSPGMDPLFITVGATFTGRLFTNYLEVTGPVPVPSTYRVTSMVVGNISASWHRDVGPAPLRSSHLVDGGSNEDGCQAFSAGAFDGAIGLVLRGNCSFTDKATHLADAGAIAAVIQDNKPGEVALVMEGDQVSIPAVMVTYEDGNRLRTWMEAHAAATAALRTGLVPYDVPDQTDAVVSFSSMGPTAWAHLKPEIVAPGALILSAGAAAVGHSSPVWELKSGTSMATPHVAGAAALVVRVHPSWGHRAIKSALVNQAKQSGIHSWTGQGRAGTLELGGGRLDLGGLSHVTMLAFPSVLDLGEVEESGTLDATVQLQLVDPDQDGSALVTLSWDPSDAALPFDPPSQSVVSFDASGLGDVHVQVAVPTGTPLGDHSGSLVIVGDDVEWAHVPYLLRVTAPVASKDLLIVDMSFAADNNTVDPVNVYEEAARDAELSYDVAPTGQLAVCPTLAVLMRYRALLVLTGDDQWVHGTYKGRGTLDRLSTYLLRGGSVIVAGQGPLRSSSHDRFTALVGTGTSSGMPLYDDSTGGLLHLDEYRVTVKGLPDLVTADLMLDPGSGLGDLQLLGELAQTVSGDVTEPWLADPWSRPVLRLTGGNFEGAGNVAMVYDPYAFYGEDRLAEAHRHRAVVLGFGLEIVKDPTPLADGTPAPGSRAELLSRAFAWATDRTSLDVIVEQDLDDPLTVQVTCQAAATNSDLATYEFDFGDGADVVFGAGAQVRHRYPRYGAFPLQVIARSDLGSAAIDRESVLVQPMSERSDAGLSDGGHLPGSDGGPDGGPEVDPPGPGGCSCHVGPSSPARSPWLPALFVLLVSGLWFARRKQ
ncbi:MAG: S8 family serine peptidase [Deltaproteobacteria bacterium]|nr:S8 family serine peptidase [Deltaproteobacteria bacterium]